MSNSIVIIGDLHLNSSTPVSRIDDYANTSIEKLETLLDICVSRKYNKIILLGDVTHKYQQPLSYIYKVMEVFNKFKNILDKHDPLVVRLFDDMIEAFDKHQLIVH